LDETKYVFAAIIPSI